MAKNMEREFMSSVRLPSSYKVSGKKVHWIQESGCCLMGLSMKASSAITNPMERESGISGTMDRRAINWKASSLRGK